MQVMTHKSLKITQRNQEMKSAEIKPPFPPSKSPHIKQAFSQFLVQLLLLAARSNQRLQTP
jgi:uncharacterized membrane protein YebE (DUF533 family)